MRLAWSLTWRTFLILPLLPVVVILILLFPLGTPFGLLLGTWVGAFITKPIRKLPRYNVNADTLLIEDMPVSDAEIIEWEDED